VVVSVVEQVYASTFKFCLLKRLEICPLKRLIFLHLNAPPDLLAELRGVKRGEGGGRGGKREGKEGKGRTPMFEVH